MRDDFFKPLRVLRPEGRKPLAVFLLIVAVSFALCSIFNDNDPYAKQRAIQSWPIVEVSTKDLIDECGVFMWVRWAGPDFDTDDPYIPMAYRYD